MPGGLRTWFSEAFGGLSLRGKLMVMLIPPVILILVVTGYINYTLSDYFIGVATERNVRVRALTITHDVESLLARCRSDLVFALGEPVTPKDMRAFLERLQQAGGPRYVEYAYVSSKPADHIFLVRQGGDVHQIPAAQVADVRPNPLLTFERAANLAQGAVLPGQPTEVEYPASLPGAPGHHFSAEVVRFVARYPGNATTPPGFLILGLDAHALRNLLSLHNSPRSPLFAYARSSELRYFYVVDPEGWMLFQSEDHDKPDLPLSTYLARAGFEGTLGRPGQPNAFRPADSAGAYWDMVRSIREGKAGLEVLPEADAHGGSVRTHYFAYAPIMFSPAPDAPPTVYGGVAFIDRTKLIMAAGYKHLDVMFIITLGTILIITIIIYILSRTISRPLNRLAHAVDLMQQSGRLEPVDLPATGYETRALQTAVNNLITRIKQQLEVIRLKDEAILNVNLKERADLDAEIAEAAAGDRADSERTGSLPEIIGLGPRMEQLRGDILKAAQVDVDVLVLGETGTGKQLAAEAIHRNSRRSGLPFISLNCGALDENLLLDALFGHIKGAFTEARGDRKGAFYEAHGGTLFLDEIQSASPKVQQSLLRALSIRKIKPLGSDTEIDVDVRVIAASNADLTELIERGEFREDLYFRLKVLSIATPPLREHPESLPLLARHYLGQAEQITGRRGMGLSRGSLEKMRAYDWPGNIREFVNCLTRAVVMAEGDVIQASDVKLESDVIRAPGVNLLLGHAVMSSGTGTPASSAPGTSPAAPEGAGSEEAESDAPEWPLQRPRMQNGPSGTGKRAPAAPARQAESSRWAETAEPGARPSRPSPLPDTPTPPPGKPLPAASADAGNAAEAQAGLNARQRKAYAVLLRQGEMSRGDYQDLFDGSLSPRAALYDLQDMVARGLVRKEGRGPATRYVLVAPGTGA
ncbi:putative sensor with HAMP domain containing protein [Desulfovibrio sp. X2]|uniref:sigma 54-interacting transcriptional regulator n=1 Tax=Desulfovibrio sp. X2 TaxID=941449 RepID=UPI00035883AF|nr:sigma 54-interacting transcriptional regulator [Desulfovibrio sp. X2]EPR41598.1 putative sensor with HAMP domain containing protein [Desulfovibrio sp. X2]